MRADLLELAVEEIADVVSGRKIFKSAAKSVGRQTLRKQLVCGGIKNSAGRVNPPEPAKQIRRPRGNLLTNVSQ